MRPAITAILRSPLKRQTAKSPTRGPLLQRAAAAARRLLPLLCVAGEIRDTWLKEDPKAVEGTFQYGLFNNFTGYVGGQSAFEGDYAALMTGFAINTRLGALGVDVTRSFTRFEGQPDTAGWWHVLQYEPAH